MKTKRKVGRRQIGNRIYYPQTAPEVKGVGAVWLRRELADAMLAMVPGSTMRASLDLGITLTTISRRQTGVASETLEISPDILRAVARSHHFITRLDATGVARSLAVVHEARLHQLAPTSTAPTVMIAGVQMHRRDDPWHDAAAKAARIVRPGDWVFDTCGGLGYTATWALRCGAGLVISTEPNPAIRWLRENNPWSPPPSAPGLMLFDSCAEEVVAHVPDCTFDAVLHDPPRLSLAGALYGRSFYAAIRRVVRAGGRLYHYTGTPYQKLRGRSFVRSTAARLAAAGFSVTWDDETAGFVGRAR